MSEGAQERGRGDVDAFGGFRDGQAPVGGGRDGGGGDPLVTDEIGEQLEGVEVLGAGQPQGGGVVGDQGAFGLTVELADLRAVLPDGHQRDALAGAGGRDLGQGL